MKLPVAVRSAASFGVAAVLVFVGAGPAASQDPDLEPTYGTVKLKAGFELDPYQVSVLSGGAIRTKLGGVEAWVAKAPDFRLHYKAGKETLTFRIKSEGDTTLLINTPDGKWLANDDTNGLNPEIKIRAPMSGRYDIWVGTVPKKNERGMLIITELK